MNSPSDKSSYDKLDDKSVLSRLVSLSSTRSWADYFVLIVFIVASSVGVAYRLYQYKTGQQVSRLSLLGLALTTLTASLFIGFLLVRRSFSIKESIHSTSSTPMSEPSSQTLPWLSWMVGGVVIVGLNGLSYSMFNLHGSLWYLAATAFALLAFMLLPIIVRRSYTRLRELALEEIKSTELKKIDFESYDVIQQLKEEKAQSDFEANIRSKIVVERLEAREMVLFPKVVWNLQPGVNVLLGRNGYGKSLILRTLAGTLQNEEDVVKILLRENAQTEGASVEIKLKRNNEDALIRRDISRSVQSVGKIPLLAIPDSRFLDRSQEAITPEDSETSDLRIYGAYHFMHQKPYGSVVRALMYEICLDYWEHGRSFNLPVFQFFQKCVKGLTDYNFQFKSITRKGRTGFEIRVLTEGNDEPMPIQYASQGTLSVVAMFGLIRSYVRSLSNNSDDEVIQTGSAIVLIDEADAHLHPAWQQRFTTLLKDLFPNVQFILSAHSPLFVAGCWRGEVAVLQRRDPNSAVSKFTLKQPNEDFVGATAAELYKRIFEIEELDDTYLEYATKATLRSEAGKRIEELSERMESGKLSPEELKELGDLEQENRRISRAVQVQQRRRKESDKDARIEDLESKILELKTQLGKRNEGMAS